MSFGTTAITTLNELIGCLEKARETHGGDAECTIFVQEDVDPTPEFVCRQMTTQELPRFEITPTDDDGPRLLAIDFTGEYGEI